jgi:hypothetical protein
MRKILVVLKWFLITIPLGIFGMITAPILYPIYDITGFKLLWIYGDSKRINPDGSFEEDYRIFLMSNTGEAKETFWQRYQWMAFRNRIWNLRTWIADIVDGDESGMTDQELVIDELTLNATKISDGGQYEQCAGLKYVVDAGQDPWQGWVGDEIDFKYSILGKSLMWFRQDGILSFRYSYCKLILNRWITLKITCIKTDTVLTFKIQKG